MARYAQEFSGVLAALSNMSTYPHKSGNPGPWEARLPDQVIAHLVTMGELHREDRDDRMTDSFQQLAGRAPIPTAEFVRRHATALTPQAGS